MGFRDQGLVRSNPVHHCHRPCRVINIDQTRISTPSSYQGTNYRVFPRVNRIGQDKNTKSIKFVNISSKPSTIGKVLDVRYTKW